MKFSQKMPLNFFYTTVQKKSKMTKNPNQGGPALKGHCHAQRWERGFVFLVEEFTYCRLSSSFWISSILGHPTLKPAQMLFFLLGHHENICFLNFLSVSQNDLGHGQVPTNVALSLSASCRTGGFGSILQFVDHLLSLEQKRQDDLVASVYLPVTSTPLRSSRSPPVTPPFSPMVAPSAGPAPVAVGRSRW